MASLEDMMGKEWFELLSPFLNENKDLLQKVSKLYKENPNQIYPPFDLIFNAFKLTPYSKVKVVIIGQDPFYTPNTAMGLAFSTSNGYVPPSLRNIYKEIRDEGIELTREDGNLVHWAEQGVFLINACLTVQRGMANSHKDIGWDKLVRRALELLFERGNLVCICWGSFSRNLVKDIMQNHDYKNILLLESTHPSPFSADKGFFGNKHFIKANGYLEEINESIIKW